VKAQVFEHNLAVLQPLRGRLGFFPSHSSLKKLAAELLLKNSGRAAWTCRPPLSVRPARCDIRTSGALAQYVLNGGQRGADARVVGDLAALSGTLKSTASTLLAFDIEVFDRQFSHGLSPRQLVGFNMK